MDPAGRLAQSGADLGLLALQQRHGAGRLLPGGRRESAARGIRGIDAPLGVEDLRGNGARRAVLGEVFGDVEADAARTHERDLLAHGHLVAQHVEVGHHLGVVDALDIGDAGRDSRGEDNDVVCREVGCRGPLTQAHLHTGLLEFATEVAEGLGKLLLAGDLLGEVELAADLIVGLEEGDLMTATGCRCGASQSGRSSADHSDALGASVGGHGFDGEDRLVTGAGVDQARGDQALEGVVKTCLIAGDAGVDPIGLSRSGFRDEVGIGEEGAGHRDHVRGTVGEHLFRDLGGVDPVGRDERDRHRSHQLLGHPGESGTRHRCRDGRDARLVPADAGVDDRRAGGLDGLGELPDLLQGGATLDEVEHGEAIDDDEVLADPLAHSSDDLDGEANSVVVGPSPLIGALVGPGGDELVDQIALGAHDLDAVITGVLSQGRAPREVVDRLLDLRAAHRLGRVEGDRRLDRARPDEVGVEGIASEVEDLEADLAARCVDGLGHQPVTRDLLVGGEDGPSLEGATGLVGCDATGHNEADPTARALGVEGGHPLEAVRRLFETHVHRTHENSVGQGGEAQVERGEEVRVCRHAGQAKQRNPPMQPVAQFWRANHTDCCVPAARPPHVPARASFVRLRPRAPVRLLDRLLLAGEPSADLSRTGTDGGRGMDLLR